MKVIIDKILFSFRKSYSLQVTENARLVIRLPYGIDEKEIRNIIKKHKRWILTKIKLAQQIKQKVKKYNYEEGEKFLYLGNSYPLTFTKNQSEPILFDKKFLISSEHSSNAKSILISWYKERAKNIFLERVEYYATLYNFNFRKVQLSSARKKWGSCSVNGDIKIAWRLVMAPLAAIDYVVVHELAHLKIKNHSKEFWRIVANVYPDYKIQRVWLKENEPLLRLT